MNNVCKNCRFWIPHSIDPNLKGECDNARGDASREIYVQVSDNSGLYVLLLTAPTFGCTLFEAGQHYSLRDYDDDVLDEE